VRTSFFGCRQVRPHGSGGSTPSSAAHHRIRGLRPLRPAPSEAFAHIRASGPQRQAIAMDWPTRLGSIGAAVGIFGRPSGVILTTISSVVTSAKIAKYGHRSARRHIRAPVGRLRRPHHRGNESWSNSIQHPTGDSAKPQHRRAPDLRWFSPWRSMADRLIQQRMWPSPGRAVRAAV